MLEVLIILSSVFIQGSNQAYPVCGTNVTCPPGGLWTEWASLGNGYCGTSCGSCSTMSQVRDCVSTNFGCNCTGSQIRQVPCNTQVCKYPAQRTCCIPYIMMNINGTLQCGPFIKPDPSTACCKAGGYWSDWGGYQNADTNGVWVRTRSCLSEEGGCPCSGESQQSKGAACPCPQMTDITDPSSYESGTTAGEPKRRFYYSDSDCTAYQYYNRSTYRSPVDSKTYTYCGTVNGTSVTQTRFQLPDKSFTTVTTATCLTIYAWTTQRFTCDLYSLFWRFAMNNMEVIATGQITFT